MIAMHFSLECRETQMCLELGARGMFYALVDTCITKRTEHLIKTICRGPLICYHFSIYYSYTLDTLIPSSIGKLAFNYGFKNEKKCNRSKI